MKRIENYETVQASSGEFSRPTAGGYIVEIVGVKNIEYDSRTGKGDYLVVDYDIAHGDFKGYYTEAHEKFGGDWWANFYRSYKESALGMFKHFINCVEASNPDYKWDWNEYGLLHQFVGIVLGEEEYRKNDGSIGTRLKVKEIKTTEQILAGDFKIPERKTLIEAEVENNSASVFEDVTNSGVKLPWEN